MFNIHLFFHVCSTLALTTVTRFHFTQVASDRFQVTGSTFHAGGSLACLAHCSALLADGTGCMGSKYDPDTGTCAVGNIIAQVSTGNTIEVALTSGNAAVLLLCERVLHCQHSQHFVFRWLVPILEPLGLGCNRGKFVLQGN